MPRKIVVVINGYPRAGKDTVVKHVLQGLYAKAWRGGAMSSIDPVRYLLKDLGVPVCQKTPAERALMAEVKSALERYDWWATRLTAQQVLGWLNTGDDRSSLCFVHIREVAAIQKLRELVVGPDIEFLTLFVDRPDAERVTSNDADTDVENMVYDLTFSNHGTLDELIRNCRQLAERIMEKMI